MLEKNVSALTISTPGKGGPQFFQSGATAGLKKKKGRDAGDLSREEGREGLANDNGIAVSRPTPGGPQNDKK